MNVKKCLSAASSLLVALIENMIAYFITYSHHCLIRLHTKKHLKQAISKEFCYKLFKLTLQFFP